MKYEWKITYEHRETKRVGNVTVHASNMEGAMTAFRRFAFLTVRSDEHVKVDPISIERAGEVR